MHIERRKRRVLTGPISVRAVSSRTFSMADREGSMGGGRTKVGPGIVWMVESQFAEQSQLSSGHRFIIYLCLARSNKNMRKREIMSSCRGTM